ncbi:perlucin-like protein [Ylistrum balloti]|uniref:perlucin-like protein n=1 Tax=Ylistrum balloti TaxID=509963 RepID=UPI002905AFF9|nr:perlucin-like protein [Ylistrum balloti]
MNFFLIFIFFTQINVIYQQNILPEHKRRHCKALQTLDIMEYALPMIRRILKEDSEKIRQEYEQVFTSLKGGFLFTCPEGWLYHDDNCYLFTTTKTTWQAARENCLSLNADLAEIINERDSYFVKSELQRIYNQEGVPKYSFYNLGGTDKANEGEWIWIRTGERIRFTNWASGEPNNVGRQEHYLTVGGTRHKWNDINHSGKCRAICQKSVGLRSVP